MVLAESWPRQMPRSEFRQGEASEQVVLDALADLTAEHGPWEACRLLFTVGVEAPARGVPRFPEPRDRPALSPRSVEAQRALIARRHAKRRARRMLTAWWAR